MRTLQCVFGAVLIIAFCGSPGSCDQKEEIVTVTVKPNEIISVRGSGPSEEMCKVADLVRCVDQAGGGNRDLESSLERTEPGLLTLISWRS